MHVRKQCLREGNISQGFSTNLICVLGTKLQNTLRDEFELDMDTIPLILSDLGS